MKNKYKRNWYTPMDIAKQRLITNSKGENSTIQGDYFFVLRLIKRGVLPAKNYSTGSVRQNWLVDEYDIDKYNRGEIG